MGKIYTRTFKIEVCEQTDTERLNEDHCNMCDFANNHYCIQHCEGVTGIDCRSDDNVRYFKKVDNWEPCTLENIKVGDTIRTIEESCLGESLATIKYLSKNLMVIDNAGVDYAIENHDFCNYEVKC